MSKAPKTITAPLEADDKLADVLAQTIDVTAVPSDPASLESISAQLRDVQHSFAEITTQYLNKAVYKVVAIGLFLLKGEQHFLLKAQADNVSGKSRKRNELGQLEAQKGFTAWLFTEHGDINERTARRYRNAARRVGLTSDSTLADVEAMREAKSLHGKSLTDLYQALPEPGATQPLTPAETATPSLVQATQMDLFATLDQVIVLKEQMEPEVYEATHLRLKTTLEALTGAKWVMLDEAPSIDASEEHGVMSEAAPSKLSAEAKARIVAAQKARWAQQKAAKGGK